MKIETQPSDLHDRVEGLRIGAVRPRTRGDCEHVPRPCPWATCRYHLLQDFASAVWQAKSSRTRLPELEELAETCALDLADQGEHTLAEIGELYDLSRERIRQLEESGLRKLARRLRAKGLEQDLLDMVRHMVDVRLDHPWERLMTAEAASKLARYYHD